MISKRTEFGNKIANGEACLSWFPLSESSVAKDQFFSRMILTHSSRKGLDRLSMISSHLRKASNDFSARFGLVEFHGNGIVFEMTRIVSVVFCIRSISAIAFKPHTSDTNSVC